MKLIRYFLSSVFVLLLINANGQTSKNGSRTVTALNTIVNEYTTLTADAAAGATTISVASSSLNANGRFTSALSAGDLLMIIQMQGASLNGVASGTITIPNDATWGAVTAYNNCGNYELVQVSAVPNGTSITIDCGLQYSYTAAGKVQIVRIPRYSTLTVNSGASITCDAWNGSRGGVVAIESGAVTVNGTIEANAKGFRGGQLTGNDTYWNLYNYATISTDGGGEKGEGIFGYQADYNVLGGSIGRGAPGNGGGGGNGWSNGGGGGANAGNIASWNGQGNPDASTAAWINAWNLESAGFATNVSSGGGRGGYSWSANNQNATTTGPTNTAWAGDNRMIYGGLGGRPLDYSTGKIYLGGGGGAGDQDNGFGGVGGAGGGIVFIHSFANVTGTGTITSNGAQGADATGVPPNNSTFAGKDAAGGGGAGGTLLIRSQGTTGISCTANGGKGGNQDIVKGTFVFTVNEAEGPGGGGGGGYIAISSGAPAQTVNGGANGTTDSDGLTEFIPNGATRGGAGLSGQTLSNYTLTAVNGSTCSGGSAALSVSITGTTPGGSVVTWYDAQVAGNVVGTGTTFNTPAITANATYYVGICPGFYRIPVNATVTPGLTVNVTPVNSSLCPGATVSLTATGGTTYTWTPSGTLSASTGSSVTASPSTTTTYTVTGVTGTCSDTAVAFVTTNTTPSISVSPAAATLCVGQSTTLTASGGVAYTWSPSTGLSSTTTAGVTANPTTTTTYTVTGTNSGGCYATAQATITVNPIPVVSVSPTTTTICSGGSVVLNASGAATYSWSPSGGLSAISGTSVTANPSTTITYTVSGTTSGCSASATSIVNVTSNPVVTVTPVSSVMCAGSSTVMTASGAATYTWSPSTGLSTTTNPTVSANPASTTTYTVTGTVSGCTDTAVAVVNVISTPVADVTPSSSSICSGDFVSMTASGGSTYSWSPSTGLSGTGTATVIANSTSTITYTVTVTNAGGCSDTAHAIVTVSPTPAVTVNPVSQTICSGNTVTLTASGATNYVWSPSTGLGSTSGATVSATPSSTQTYTVTGTSGSCSDTAITIVNVASSLAVSVIPANTTICSGSTVVLTASGASNYVWSPAGGLSSTTGASVTSSATVTTTYTVTGSSGSCSDTGVVIVQVTPSANLSLTVSDTTICEGTTVSFNASGATSYTWTGASLSSASGPSVTANPTSTSTYTVVGDVGTCSDTIIKVITVQSIPVVTVTPASAGLCSGGSVSLTASGATSYDWTPGTGLSGTTGATVIANPTSTSTYTVTGTIGSCIDTATVEITVMSTLVASASASSPDICPGDSTTLTVTGGVTYLWSPSSGLSSTSGSVVNASPSLTTTYTVVASAGTCTDTAEVIVKVNTIPVLSVTVSSDTICEGSTTTIDVTGATSYQWSPSASLSSTTAPTVTASPDSTETFTVVGFNLTCSDTLTQVITVEINPVVSLTLSDDSICSGSTAVFTASGASTYEWSPGTGLSSSTGATVIASPTVTTTYTVTGTLGNCFASIDTVLEVIDVTLAPGFTANTLCEGDSIQLVVTGAETYTISPMTGVTVNDTGDYYLKPPVTTTYEIIGTKYGCTDTTQVTITITPAPSITVTAGPQTICEGSSVTMSVTGAPSYVWSPSQFLDNDTASTVIATPSSTTTFTVVGYIGSCGTMDTIIVDVMQVNLTVTASPVAVCPGSSTVLTVSGADTYMWTPSSDLSSTSGATVTANPTAAATYTVTGTDLNGCTDTTDVAITMLTLPASNAGADLSTCQSSIGITALDPAPDSGVWSVLSGSGSIATSTAPSTTISGLMAGTTELVWTVSNSCGTASDTMVINVGAGPTVDVTASPSTICPGNSSTLTASASGGAGTYTYSWSNSATTSSQSVSPVITETYSVEVTDALGCVSSPALVTVNVASQPTITASADVTIIKGESTQLSATGGASYQWSPSTSLTSPGSAATIASPMATTVYTVTGTDANGCTASDEVIVTVEEKTHVFIPDIFSPNNDGRNDILYVRGGNIASFRFMVFDRWGEKVFETEDQSVGWDGTLRGKPMDEAVYVYILRGTYLDGSSIEINGNVTLLR